MSRHSKVIAQTDRHRQYENLTFLYTRVVMNEKEGTKERELKLKVSGIYIPQESSYIDVKRGLQSSNLGVSHHLEVIRNMCCLHIIPQLGQHG